MRTPRLDFLHPAPRPHWLASVLLVAGLLFAGTSWLRYQDARDAEASEQLIATNLSAQRPQARTARREMNGTASTQTSLSQEQLDIHLARWDHFLAGLEQSRPRKIAVLSIEADARRRVALLTLEATEHRVMLDYIGHLRQVQGIHDVVLSSHSVDLEDPDQPIEFVVRLRWGRA